MNRRGAGSPKARTRDRVAHLPWAREGEAPRSCGAERAAWIARAGTCEARDDRDWVLLDLRRLRRRWPSRLLVSALLPSAVLAAAAIDIALTGDRADRRPRSDSPVQWPSASLPARQRLRGQAAGRPRQHLPHLARPVSAPPRGRVSAPTLRPAGGGESPSPVPPQPQTATEAPPTPARSGPFEYLGR
jgi:hypothetical protein